MDLARAFLRAEVDRRTYTHRAEVDGLSNRREGHLVATVRVGQQLVVVELDDERDLVCVATGDDPETPSVEANGAALGREASSARFWGSK